MIHGIMSPCSVVFPERLVIPVYEKIVSTGEEPGALCLKVGVYVSIWHKNAYMKSMFKNVKEGTLRQIAIYLVDP